jgi:cysteine desulfurase/selenocysteine lyase
MEAIRAHDVSLTTYAMATLAERLGDDIHIFGPADPSERGGVLSFAYRDIHPHDISQILDQYGVCVRAGHHCAKPLMRRLGVNATARASFGPYNDESDVDTLADALTEAGAFFG